LPLSNCVAVDLLLFAIPYSRAAAKDKQRKHLRLRRRPPTKRPEAHLTVQKRRTANLPSFFVSKNRAGRTLAGFSPPPHPLHSGLRSPAACETFTREIEVLLLSESTEYSIRSAPIIDDPNIYNGSNISPHLASSSSRRHPGSRRSGWKLYST